MLVACRLAGLSTPEGLAFEAEGRVGLNTRKSRRNLALLVGDL
jgi:hypothetical protein